MDKPTSKFMVETVICKDDGLDRIVKLTRTTGNQYIIELITMYENPLRTSFTLDSPLYDMLLAVMNEGVLNGDKYIIKDTK